MVYLTTPLEILSLVPLGVTAEHGRIFNRDWFGTFPQQSLGELDWMRRSQLRKHVLLTC